MGFFGRGACPEIKKGSFRMTGSFLRITQSNEGLKSKMWWTYTVPFIYAIILEYID